MSNFRRLITIGILAISFTPTLVAQSGAAIGQDSFGSFAGYTWLGRPHSISAQWRVPRILPSSAAGFAATWIGVQGEKAFVQIGSVENKVASGRRRSTDVYQCFWSDPQLQYHPAILGDLSPGDLVSASIRATPMGWQLFLRDNRSHESFTAVVKEAGLMNESEWLQEDPAGRSGSLPYALTGAVHFSRLETNGQPPTLADLMPSWISANSVTYATSPISNNSFAVTTPPALVQQQFLTDSSQFDQLAAGLLGQCSALTTQGASNLQSAITQLNGELDVQSWPADAQPLITELEAAGQAVASGLAAQNTGAQAGLDNACQEMVLAGFDASQMLAIPG